MPDLTSIYLDFDDVLCRTADGLIDIARERFGRRVAFDAIHSFDLAESFDLDPGQLAVLMEAAHHPDVVLAFDPMPGARAVLERWHRSGWRIVVVTGRPPSTRAASVQWLEREGMPCDEVLFVDKYGRFEGDDARHGLPLAVVIERPFALAVDDSPAMIQLLQDSPCGRVAVFDRPWNRMLSDHPRVARVRGWTELGELLPAIPG